MFLNTLTDRRREPRHNVQGPCWFDVDTVLHSGLLVEVSAVGAYVIARKLPPVGSWLMLAHATGGAVAAQVVRHGEEGFALRFELGEPSVTFALRAVAGALSAATEQD
jgi:PilZ domain